MKQPIEMTIQLAHNESNRMWIGVMRELADGKSVSGVLVLKLGLWLVTEITRRQQAPSFRRGGLGDRLRRARTLGSKYMSLAMAWPGAPEPRPHEIDEDRAAMALLKMLTEHAPVDANPFNIDTSGDI